MAAADDITRAILKYEEFNAGMIFLLKNEWPLRKETSYALTEMIAQRHKRMEGNNTGKCWRLTEANVLEFKGKTSGPSQASE